MVEASAHENVNVDSAFFAVAQLVDRSRGTLFKNHRTKHLEHFFRQTFQQFSRKLKQKNISNLCTHCVQF